MLTLNMLSAPLGCCLMRKGPRVFGLLGKATPTGIAAFGADDVSRSWAVTAEHGCVRLERMSGNEEVTGLELLLPTAMSYDYGIAGAAHSPALTRAVFGLMPSELEDTVNVLRRGNFPVLSFSRVITKCSLSSAIIPGCWPHVVVSDQALYGNVLSVESFVRLLVASLPHGHLATRYPALQPMLKQMMTLMIAQRRGLPYSSEILNLAPAEAMAMK
jgi:hypothetical protein